MQLHLPPRSIAETTETARCDPGAAQEFGFFLRGSQEQCDTNRSVVAPLAHLSSSALQKHSRGTKPDALPLRACAPSRVHRRGPLQANVGRGCNPCQTPFPV